MSAWSKPRANSKPHQDSKAEASTDRSRGELEFWVNAVGSPLLVVERHALAARYGNRAAETMFGVSAAEFDGMALLDLVGPEANEMLGQIWSNAPLGVTGEPFLIRAQVRDQERLLMVQVAKIVVADEELRLFTLVDAPPQGSVALAGWQEKIIDMLNWLPFGFEIASTDEQIQFANKQFNELFGYSQDEIASIEDWWRLAYPDPDYRQFARSTWEGELARARAEDREMTPFDLDVRTSSGRDRTIQFRHRTIGSFNVNLYLDVTSERAAARELKRLSEIDPLTGIMNRRKFFEQASARYSSHVDGVLGILVLDLDDFKSVNDRHGHGVGDQVLQEFSERCSSVVDGNALFARFGGEEFVALLSAGDENSVLAVAEQIRSVIGKRRFEVAATSLKVTVSGGLAYRSPREELSQTISRADEALYTAKRSGRNRICI